jgi:hypothetical protein
LHQAVSVECWVDLYAYIRSTDVSVGVTASLPNVKCIFAIFAPWSDINGLLGCVLIKFDRVAKLIAIKAFFRQRYTIFTFTCVVELDASDFISPSSGTVSGEISVATVQPHIFMTKLKNLHFLFLSASKSLN